MLTLCDILLSNVKHSIVQSSAHQELETEIVDSLGIAICLTLLGPIPVKNQAVAESQAGGGVGGIFVAIEHGSSQSSFNMTDNLLLKAVLVAETLGLVSLPSITLRLWDRSY